MATKQELLNFFMRANQKKHNGTGTYLHKFAPMPQVEERKKAIISLNDICEVYKYENEEGKVFEFEQPIPMAEFNEQDFK